MSLNDIVIVNVSRQTKVPTQVGFGTPLILGQHTRFAEKARLYSDMDAVAEDFQTTDAEYKAANQVFSQNPRVGKVLIGKRAANVAQVVNFAVATVQNSTAYTATINGVDYTYTSDSSATQAEIEAGLALAIDAAPGVAAVDATGVDVTADVAGVGFTATGSANLTVTTTTANGNVASELQLVSNFNNDWYLLILTSHTDADILAAAAYIESKIKLFGASSSSAGLLSNGGGNIGAAIKALNYDRTFLVYHETPDSSFPEAVWAGLTLPQTPGSLTWKFKSGAGLVPSDSLTDSQVANLILNRVNLYQTIAGIPMFSEGVLASGEFIDIIHGTDDFTADCQARVFGLLVAEPKVPFTNAGIDSVKSQVNAALRRSVGNGVLSDDPAPSVTAPLVADIPKSEKATRFLNNVKFKATYAGAIHKVQIDGTITV